jgi:hypothetical protein
MRRLDVRDPANPDSFKVGRAKVGGYRDYLTPEEVAAARSFLRANLAPRFGYLSSPGA